MGITYGAFKYEIGELITSHERNLTIIDREYRDTIGAKRGKEYSVHHKWYKYRCNDCGNEDWIVEYAIGDRQHIGCNVCCVPPKKIVRGINDISTTAPWMLKYIKNVEDAYTHSKATREEIEFVCPDCGRIHKRGILGVYQAKTLTCPCNDNWSYPNKFMHSVLEQAGVAFTPEKSFDWSEKRIYDDYIEHNGLKIITEQHGQQHYIKQFNLKGRTLDEEKENDKLKYDLAIANGIDYYFVIDCSKSDKEYIKNSICNTELLSVLGVTESDIDWNKCDEFATSNFMKAMCEYINDHPELKSEEVAKVFIVPIATIHRCNIKGREMGWIDDIDKGKYLRQHGLIAGNTKPIYCITNGKYYRDSYAVCDDIYPTTNEARSKRLRKHIFHNKPYCGYIFKYISQEEFNNEKRRVPDKCVGDFFNI